MEEKDVNMLLALFGKDILGKCFDADTYKGGAYIEVKDNVAYIIEVSFECETMCLIKLPNISAEALFNRVFEEVDNDYYTIGYIYSRMHKVKDSSESEKIKEILCAIYNNETNWVLDDTLSRCYKIEYKDGRWNCNLFTTQK